MQRDFHSFNLNLLPYILIRYDSETRMPVIQCSFGVRSAYPLWNRSRETELHSWDSFPNHHLNMGCPECHRINMGLEHQFCLILLREKKPFILMCLGMTFA